MEYTAVAQWLNTFFAGYDGAILTSLAKLADAAGGFFTPVMKFITLLGEKGLMMFILALVCMCFARTRKLGVCIFGAVCCGALITNIILKDMVARPRPFEFSTQFQSFWRAVGSPAEDGFSFPSGHVTAASAGVAALCFVEGRKWVIPSVVWVFLMGFSRNYLMAHFPSDVLFAMLIGLFSAFVAYLITKAIFNYVEDNDDFPLYNRIMYFSLPLPDFALIGGRLADTCKSAADTGRNAADAAVRAVSSVKLPGRSEAKPTHRAAEAERGGNSRPASRSEKRRAGAAAGHSRAAASAEAAKAASGAAPRAESRKTASDWSARWEAYRSAHSPNAEQGEGSYAPRVAPVGAETASVPRANSASAVPDSGQDEDADMKIALPRKKSAAAAKPEAEAGNAVSPAAEAQPAEVSEFDADGIDWARLGLDFSSAELSGNDAEREEPVRRRRSARSSADSSSRSSGYRGRHEL